MYSFCVGFSRFQTDKNRIEPEFQWFGFLSVGFGSVEIKNRNQTDRFGLKPELFRGVERMIMTEISHYENSAYINLVQSKTRE
jgi:hypothetical protein